MTAGGDDAGHGGLFSNLVVRRYCGTLVSSSFIQILGVPSPVSTKNLSSLKRSTEDFEAYPLLNKKLELDLGNDLLQLIRSFFL